MRAALAALPGVRHITVDFEKKQAVATFSASAYDEHKLIDALEQAGFGGSVQATKRISEKQETEQETESSLPPRPGLGDGVEQTVPQQENAAASRGFGEHVAVVAQLDHDALRPGDLFRIAVVLDIQEGWHIYGNPIGPGIGKPTVLSAKVPQGIRIDSARYPPAQKEEQVFGEAGKSWVWEYTGRAILYLTGRVAETARPRSLELPITLDGQVCTSRTCIPGKVNVPFSVRIVPDGSPTHAMQADLFIGFDNAKSGSESNHN